MSRRSNQYRQFKGKDVDETMDNITRAHRPTKNIGRRKIGVFMPDTSTINQYVPSSLPIKPEKALRLAQTLHRTRS